MAPRRKQLILTQSEIAALAGMTQPAVCRKLRRGMSVEEIFIEARHRREMEAHGMETPVSARKRELYATQRAERAKFVKRATAQIRKYIAG